MVPTLTDVESELLEAPPMDCTAAGLAMTVLWSSRVGVWSGRVEVWIGVEVC